ncbi:MAG TPA: DUF4091 domain-containing protein [Ilumatobacter sp.]|nr:DUF4091 domain-containing protein [Ilumatobacter sp.]
MRRQRDRRSPWYALFGTLGFLAVGASDPASVAAQPDGAVVSVAPSVVNVDPDRPYSGATTIALTVLRNETESFQVIVQADAAAVPGLDLAVTIGGGLTARAHRVGYYTITGEASDCEAYTTCPGALSPRRWGDALIPAVDRVWNEDRPAFRGWSVGAGANGAFWVDVSSSSSATSPGVYQGSATVTSNGSPVGSVYFSVEVLDVVLPDTSSLPMLIGMSSTNELCLAHTNSACSSAVHRPLLAEYVRMGLDYRIGVSMPWAWMAPDTGGRFATYQRPLLTGETTFPPGATWQLGSPRLTQAGLYVYVAPGDGCPADCVARWHADATTHGYADRLLYYACDEPGANVARWRACADGVAARDIPSDSPGRYLVTSTLHDLPDPLPAGMPTPHVLAPNARNVDGTYMTGTNPRTDTSGTYTDHDLWLYVACDTEGCANPAGNEQVYTGWPSLAIDTFAAQQRALPWMAWVYGAAGILHWDVVANLDTAWTNQNRGGAGYHGDGTLFYPGRGCTGDVHATQGCIGGNHDVPLASVRLARLRDGLEDYELLRWLDARGRGADARAIVDGRSGAPALLRTTSASAVAMNDVTAAKDGTGPGSLQAARDALLAIVRAELGVSAPPPLPPPLPEPSVASPPQPFDTSVLFTGSTPVRAIDTRAGAPGRLADGQVLTWNTGGTTALAVNLTAVAPTGAGWLAAYPCTGGFPGTSSLNFVEGVTVANLVLVAPDADGLVCIRARVTGDDGYVDVLADVSGTLNAGRGFHAERPSRVLDTRTSFGKLRGARTYSLDGYAPGVVVALNVTVTDAEAAGYITVYPCAAGRPTASVANYVPGRARAALALVAADARGQICLFTRATVHLVIDRTASLGEPGAQFVAPTRVFDSRTTAGGAGPATEFVLRFDADVGRALALVVTVTDPRAAGHITVYPCAGGRPVASVLNYAVGETVPNTVLVRPGGDGRVCFSSHAATNLVVDRAGSLESAGG